MTSSVAMRAKGRRLITYHYDVDDPDRLSYEEEEVWEPVDEPVKPGEFAGANLSALLDHGIHPDSLPELKAGTGFIWGLEKLYEKKAVWVRRAEDVPVK